MFDSLKVSLVEMLRPVLPLPVWQKLLVLAITFVLIVGAYIYVGWLPIQEEIVREEQALEMQKVLLAKNQRLAQDLPRKQKEYAQLEKQLKVALNMLPKKSQIPDLLESVSWAGKDSGLEFSIFKPEREVAKQIYAEVPVALDVTGTFRQLLTFLKRVGEMPRIVDVKNLTLTQANDNELTVKGQAVTYRFVEEAPKSTKTGRGN
ncbi:type IV pilus assembly protein PilO [Mariprofundus ferrinatatus]|uniref:Type IV pilus assembly protein PilO n=1 Tax=Mariprofundus ferrinatatus TaxID=1921087 RepID=A0A2K8LE78_9PROT|nr:type 4a pilus biogenesis protein PilO [Mariprofundus ferrinatatus]ATX82586.1 type IV pilus assembly protein PilO [Mariprofundus ferrinatatus]